MIERNEYDSYIYLAATYLMFENIAQDSDQQSLIIEIQYDIQVNTIALNELLVNHINRFGFFV